MCGILGSISFRDTCAIHQDSIVKATSYLKYRGPDDVGQLYIRQGNARVSFSHTRLSIIDLTESGRQPMTSMSGRTSIVFNGEIYNYKILRAELEQNGFIFQTNSDTEVILHGYECWSLDGLLNKLDGMFALALFDRQSEQLVLARDRFGKKPLYYYCKDYCLTFSSDIRSIRDLHNRELTLDKRSLGYFFAELSTPMDDCIWREVKKIRPGNYLVFGENVIELKSFWGLQYNESCALSRSQILDETDHLLTKAVGKRLVADVRVSALLSGGIDSSLVVAKMAQLSNGKIKTYSVGFNHESYDELPFARQTATRFETDHSEVVVDFNLLDFMDKLILEYGEPFADSSMLPLYIISKEVSKTEKVVLGGDGGDEMFGGYYSHYFAHRYDLLKRLKFLLPLVNLVSARFSSYRIRLLADIFRQIKKPEYTLLNRNLGFNTEQLQMLCHDPEFFNALDEHRVIWEMFSAKSKSDLINLLSASQRTRLLNDYLVKVDRATMFASLEMRSPFLDKDMAEFVSKLRVHQFFKGGEPKSILKELALRYFPKEFVYRKKRGFEIPIGKWFQGPLRQKLLDTVLGGKQYAIDLNYSYVENILNQHVKGEVDHSHRVWSLYVFHVWAQQI